MGKPGAYVPLPSPPPTHTCTDTNINEEPDGKLPLIALRDVGSFNLWIFDHPSQSSGLDLEVATDEVSFSTIASTFTRVTGKKAEHIFVPFDDDAAGAEPYPNAFANWAAGPDAERDESVMTWRQNFKAWWKYWGEGVGATRDFGLLDRILPGRVGGLEEWMRVEGYEGVPRAVLKGREDLKAAREGKGK